MYVKGLVVVALCTLFVLSFALVINYEAAGIGKGQTISTSQGTCQTPQTTCESFSITSASLRTVNYTDELGVVNYAIFTVGLNVSGRWPITSIGLFVGGASGGAVQGLFEPGVNRVVNLTLPATIAVTPGKTYLVSVEGFYGSGSEVWKSANVTAQ